jgi:LacI family transcriptional regulator
VTHPYRIREIAEQSGLSSATVDRVLHARPGVRPSTVAEVRRAIDDLDHQASQLALSGRTFIVDLVMLTPRRFSRAVRAALVEQLPNLRPASVRARFHLAEEGTPRDLVRTLQKIRGSHGIILKAPDDPLLVAEIARLEIRGVPVVTLVTDLPGSRRIAYAGIDDRAAGATAAYLVGAIVPGAGEVLVALSRSSFRGEEQRVAGFRAVLGDRAIHEVTDTDGLDHTMFAAASDALGRHPGIDAVYSPGGGNRAILAAFARPPAAYIAHDLDEDNVALLRQRRITAVLHHDLRDDLRRACVAILQANGAWPGCPTSRPSPVQVITPYNQPDHEVGAGRNP